MTLQLSVKLCQVDVANKNCASENVFLLSPLCWYLYSQSNLGIKSAEIFF